MGQLSFLVRKECANILSQNSVLPCRYRLLDVLQRWQMPLAPGDASPPWIVITVVSTVGALVFGVVSGAFGLWVLQKRRKRKRYLSSLDRDSEDDLMISRDQVFL